MLGQDLIRACKSGLPGHALRILATDEGREAAAGFHDAAGRNVLHHAAERGLTSVVEEVAKTESGRKLLTEKDFIARCTPLHCAVEKGKADMVEALIGTPEGRRAMQEKVFGLNDRKSWDFPDFSGISREFLTVFPTSASAGGRRSTWPPSTAAPRLSGSSWRPQRAGRPPG